MCLKTPDQKRGEQFLKKLRLRKKVLHKYLSDPVPSWGEAVLLILCRRKSGKLFRSRKQKCLLIYSVPHQSGKFCHVSDQKYFKNQVSESKNLQSDICYLKEMDEYLSNHVQPLGEKKTFKSRTFAASFDTSSRPTSVKI